MKLSRGNGTCLKSTFDHDLRPFDPKLKRCPPVVMVKTFAKYHHCMSKGNGVIVSKPLFHIQTDGQAASHGETSIHPTTSFEGDGGYNDYTSELTITN